MHELFKAIPDVETVLTLEPEELGATLLVLMVGRKKHDPNFKIHFGNLSNDLCSGNSSSSNQYPQDKWEQVRLALAEAWNWLEVQGLLIPASGGGAQDGWRLLSRKASQFTSQNDVRKYSQSRRFSRELLHPRLKDKVWSDYIRSQYDGAVFHAMKAVEVAVREAAPSVDPKLLGVPLVRAAFATGNGPLTDTAASIAEQEARASLFAGAIGGYKNPQSHRDVNLDDPDEAAEIVMLANHLLRIVDRRIEARQD